MKILPTINSALAVITSLTLLTAQQSLMAQVEGNLFPEGAFEMEAIQGMPEGWGIPDKNDRPWKGGSVVSIETEEGGHYARLTTVAEFPYLYALSAVIPVPEGKKTLNVSARMRMKMETVPGDWNGFKFNIGFAEVAGTGPGTKDYNITNDNTVFSLQENSEEWKTLTGNVVVPEGAKFICIRLFVGSMLGTFDIDDITITTD